MKIKTGKGTISLWALLGIWSETEFVFADFIARIGYIADIGQVAYGISRLIGT